MANFYTISAKEVAQMEHYTYKEIKEKQKATIKILGIKYSEPSCGYMLNNYGGLFIASPTKILIKVEIDSLEGKTDYSAKGTKDQVLWHENYEEVMNVAYPVKRDNKWKRLTDKRIEKIENWVKANIGKEFKAVYNEDHLKWFFEEGTFSGIK